MILTCRLSAATFNTKPIHRYMSKCKFKKIIIKTVKYYNVNTRFAFPSFDSLLVQYYNNNNNNTAIDCKSMKMNYVCCCCASSKMFPSINITK